MLIKNQKKRIFNLAIFNSVIIAHRDRPRSLKVLLRGLLLAGEQISPKSYEIVISDLGSNGSCRGILNKYVNETSLNLKVIWNKYQGQFWKTKALNNAARNSTGEYITMIDCDALVPCSFLKGIEKFFSKEKHKNTKLCHRVIFLTPMISRSLYARADKFDCLYIDDFIMKKSKHFIVARERYTGQEKFLEDFPGSKWGYLTNKCALGNSHFTVSRKHYMDIGGHDEGFKGHGLEDMDFNLRLWRYLEKGTLRTHIKHAIFHFSHSKGNDWLNMKYRVRNRKVYRGNKKRRIIKVPKKSDWGKF